VVDEPLNEEPEAGVQVFDLIPELSVALKVNVTVAFVLPESGPLEMSAGQETTGGIVSTTLIVKEQVEVKLKALVAVHVTELFPKLNREPEAGEHEDVVAELAGSETTVEKATRADAELLAV
jgi:paraquat-inducible protein B